MVDGRAESTLCGVTDLYVTEPVPIMEGKVVGCEHRGAGLFCPDCGQRTGVGS
jgi:hypothetical protein